MIMNKIQHIWNFINIMLSKIKQMQKQKKKTQVNKIQVLLNNVFFLEFF